MAGAFVGLVVNETMLRHHQGQPPVGDQLGVYRLAHVPYLGQGHFKAHRSGGHFQGTHDVHGGGVEDIQAEISVNPHSRLPHGGNQAEISHQRVPDAGGAEDIQTLFDPGQLSVVDDSGQHRRQPSPLHQPGAKLPVGKQNVDGNVQHGGFQIQKHGGQLLP